MKNWRECFYHAYHLNYMYVWRRSQKGISHNIGEYQRKIFINEKGARLKKLHNLCIVEVPKWMYLETPKLSELRWVCVGNRLIGNFISIFQVNFHILTLFSLQVYLAAGQWYRVMSILYALHQLHRPILLVAVGSPVQSLEISFMRIAWHVQQTFHMETQITSSCQSLPRCCFWACCVAVLFGADKAIYLLYD